MMFDTNKRGFYGKGRPKFGEDKKKEIVLMYKKSDTTMEKLAKEHGCSSVSIHKWVKKYESELDICPEQGTDVHE